MPKSGKITVFMVALIGFAALAFLGWQLSQAQVRTQGKPTPPCNLNEVCENAEFNGSYSFDAQPCLDCRNKGYGPLLMIENPGQQLAGHQCQIDRVFQILYYGNGIYKVNWAGVAVGFVEAALIGDANRDGFKEIVGVGSNQYTVGSKKNVQHFYDLDIWMFKNGSAGQAACETLRTGYSSNHFFSPGAIIADANNDGFDDELVVSRGKQLEIYRWDEISNSFSMVWQSPVYEHGIRRLDCGDADNDGAKELILALSNGGAFGVLESLGGDVWGNFQLSESSDASWLNDARVRDADNDGSNEVIGGGSSKQFLIWKYDNGIYKKVYTRSFGDTTYVDAGDVDGCGSNEVILKEGILNLNIYIFDLTFDAQSETYALALRASLSGISKGGHFTLGNMDGDSCQEIFMGPIVFDFDGINLQKTCENVYFSAYPTVK